ncbi:MAG: hypothetical protein RLZ14_985 [Actinomycetota bacterium]
MTSTPNETSAVEPFSAPVRWRRSRVAFGLVAVLMTTVTATGLQRVDAAKPASCSGTAYTVVAGDFWARIAQRAGVALDALLSANGATTGTLIHPGQVLCIPAPPPPTTPATTSPATTAPPVKVSIAQFPVQGPCWFTDTWGAPRSGGRSHEGVDIIARSGLLVYAVDDGTLTKQYIDTPGALPGNGWRLQRADGTYFFYGHFSAFAEGLSVGSKVKAGQIIGYVGMTGNAGSPHLHFEVHPVGGAAVNPTSIVRALDGCRTSAVPPQPGGTPPTTTPTTTPTTPAPPTTVPGTVKPPTTTSPPPVTTAPATTVPVFPPPPVAQGTTWRFTAPASALDTRGHRLAAGKPTSVQVAGLGGVPDGTQGVLLRINVRNAAARGSVTVHPCGTSPSGAATLGFMPGKLNATTTAVKVVNGAICLTPSAAVDVRLEVVGVQAADGVGLQPITATRALDTRASGVLAAGGTKVALPKALGAPRGSKAVTATITLIDPAAAGSIGIGPCGGTPWILGFAAVPAQVFSAVVRTNDSGVCVSSSVDVQVVLDVTGVWSGSSSLVPVAPTRVYDSRPSGPITAKGLMTHINVPKGATRGQFHVSAIAGAQGGALFMWDCLQPRPTAAAVSVGTDSVSTAAVSMSVASSTLCLSSTGSLNVVVDLVAAG